MLTPRTISLLRRSGAWDVGRAVHQTVAPPVCSVVHRAVLAAPADRLPRDLVLKHRFDGTPLWVDPRRVVGMIRVGEWAHPESESQGRTRRFRRWWIRGGGNKTVLRHLSRNVHGRFVVAGDWDRKQRPFQLRDSIAQLLEGTPSRETDEYRRIAAWIAIGDLRWTRGCRTIEDLDRYFDALDRCVSSIRAHGYLTQQQLGHDGGDEIRVCIDRDGQLSVFGGGSHRLSIAITFGLPHVPVTVKRVHADWVAMQQQRFSTSDDLVAIERGVATMGTFAPPDTRPRPTRADRSRLRGVS